MFKKALVVFVVLLLALSACAPAANREAIPEEPAADQAFGGGEVGVAPSAPEAEGGFSAGNVVPQQVDSIERVVIKNANLSIAVSSPTETLDAIVRMAESMGGYVVSSNLYEITNSSGVEYPRANVTVRIPAERLNDALEQIKSGAGEVLNENVTGQDVTQEYVDLQSRLRNLEDVEAQLREIMASATKTEDVLRVFNELKLVRQEIEVIKGQIQYYDQSARLSSISVDIQAEEAIQPLAIGRWKPVGVARDAVQALINALQFLANTGIWLVLFWLPVGALVITPIYFLVRWLRGLRRKSKAQEVAAAAPTVES